MAAAARRAGRLQLALRTSGGRRRCCGRRGRRAAHASAPAPRRPGGGATATTPRLASMACRSGCPPARRVSPLSSAARRWLAAPWSPRPDSFPRVAALPRPFGSPPPRRWPSACAPRRGVADDGRWGAATPPRLVAPRRRGRGGRSTGRAAGWAECTARPPRRGGLGGTVARRLAAAFCRRGAAAWPGGRAGGRSGRCGCGGGGGEAVLAEVAALASLSPPLPSPPPTPAQGGERGGEWGEWARRSHWVREAATLGDGGSVSPNGGGSGRAGAVSEDCIPCGRRWLCVTGGVMLATVLRVWTVSVPKVGDGVVGCRLSQGQTVEERKPWTSS